MKIIAIISAFLSLAAGLCVNVNTNTSSAPITSENVSVTSVSETVKSEPAVTETKTPDAEKEVTAAGTVTEVQITEAVTPEITEPAETEECEVENTEPAVTEPVVTGSALTEKEPAEIPEETVSENEEPEYYEYQIVYKELLDKLRFETDDIFAIEYTIHDMDHDDVPELITVTGKCEADKTTTFYTIKDHEAVVVGEGFRGDHSAFYIDARTDRLAIRSDWCGTGCVISYDFDGEKITEADILEDHNIMDDPEEYAENIEKMFDLRFDGYGLAYAEGSSNFVSAGGIVTKLNDGAYFFNE